MTFESVPIPKVTFESVPGSDVTFESVPLGKVTCESVPFIASERKLREAWACCTCSVAGRSLEPTCLSGSLGETLVLRRCPVGTDVGVPGWPNWPTMCSWNGNLDDGP